MELAKDPRLSLKSNVEERAQHIMKHLQSPTTPHIALIDRILPFSLVCYNTKKYLYQNPISH
jgi:hypothetical protein